MNSLKNKTILITGSSIGIGRETALLLAKEGCRIAITYYKDRKEAEATAKECIESGSPDVLAVQLNVLDNRSIKNSVKKAVARFGKIDILINNAGIVVWNKLESQGYKDIENQIRTNLEGLIKMTKECLPHMKDTIINIASGAGLHGFGDLTTYCATKFGVRGFSQSLALEIPHIKVYVVNPGKTATRMNDFHGMPPEKVAEVIVNTAKGKYRVPSGGDVNVWDVI